VRWAARRHARPGGRPPSGRPGSVSPLGGEHQFGDCLPRVWPPPYASAPNGGGSAGKRNTARWKGFRKRRSRSGSLFSLGALRHPLSVAWRRTLIRGFPLTEVPPIVHPGPDRRRSGRVEPQGLAWTERSWLGSLLIQGVFHRTPNSFPVCPCTFPTGRAPCRKTPPEDVTEPDSTSRHRPRSGPLQQCMRDCRACSITSQVRASTRGDDPFRGAPVKMRVLGPGRPRRRRSGRRLAF